MFVLFTFLKIFCFVYIFDSTLCLHFAHFHLEQLEQEQKVDSWAGLINCDKNSSFGPSLSSLTKVWKAIMIKYLSSMKFNLVKNIWSCDQNWSKHGGLSWRRPIEANWGHTRPRTASSAHQGLVDHRVESRIANAGRPRSRSIQSPSVNWRFRNLWVDLRF